MLFFFVGGKVIEGLFGNGNDMVVDKFVVFVCVGFIIFQVVFLFQYCLVGKIIFGQFIEYFFEVDLFVVGRVEMFGLLLSGLVFIVDVIVFVVVKFGVFDVKCFNMCMIDIDIGQVVYLLQMQVVWVIEYIVVWMVIYQCKKMFKGYVIVQVFVGVDFIVDIDFLFVEEVQQWLLVLGQFGKGFIQKWLIVWWLWIKKGLCQCFGKGCVCLQFQVVGGYCCLVYFFYCLVLVCLWIVMQCCWGKGVKCCVICWMYCYQLFFKVSGQFVDYQFMFCQDVVDFVVVGLVCCCLFDIKNCWVVVGDL